MRDSRRSSLGAHPPQEAVEEQHGSGAGLGRFGAVGGEVGRRRSERRDLVIAGGIVLGGAGAGLPDEGDGAGNVAVVDAEGGFGGFAGEKLGEQFIIIGLDPKGFLAVVVD